MTGEHTSVLLFFFSLAFSWGGVAFLASIALNERLHHIIMVLLCDASLHVELPPLHRFLLRLDIEGGIVRQMHVHKVGTSVLSSCVRQCFPSNNHISSHFTSEYFFILLTVTGAIILSLDAGHLTLFR